MRFLLIINNGQTELKTEYTKELEERLQGYLKEKQEEIQSKKGYFDENDYWTRMEE